MRIVFLTWRDLVHPSAGGSEVVVDAYARELQRRGHEVAVLCGGPVGVHEYEVVSLGGTYTQYLRAPFVARRFADWDLLVDVSNGIPFFSPLWWRGRRVCLFHHVHGHQWHLYFPTTVARLGSFLESTVMPRVYRSTPFAPISQSTADGLAALGVPAEHLRVVISGVDPSYLVPPVAESAEPLFLALGRVARNKSIDRLMEIWSQVRPITGGRLVVAGDGPEREALEARGCVGVEFTGYIGEAEKVELLGSAWMLVHAAPREGWGLVLVEAAAQGTPTIAFDVDGVRDAVVDGETGLLVDGDDEFAKAWIELAEDPVRRHEMGRAAAERARGFTWARSTDHLLEAAGLGTAGAGTGVNDSTHPATGSVSAPGTDAHPVGLARSARLFELYRREPSDPAPFYEFLARDTMEQLERFDAEIEGLVVDVGGGPGYIAEAIRAKGGRPVVVEYSEQELHLHGRVPRDAVVGDGQRLPLRSDLADVVHSSNVLEHVREPTCMLAEMVRVLRPGGIGYLSYTPWLSPWGGHETSPWHFLGGARAAERFERRTGQPPKNEFGTSLFVLRMRPVLDWFEAQTGSTILWEGPRYWPPSWRAMTRLPVLGEVVAWNHLIVFQKRGSAPVR